MWQKMGCRFGQTQTMQRSTKKPKLQRDRRGDEANDANAQVRQGGAQDVQDGASPTA